MTSAEPPRRIRAALHDQLLQTFRYDGRESGGVLGLRAGEIICSHYDASAHAAPDFYIPSPEQTAAAIDRFHRIDGCDEICFIHAHPSGYSTLSTADRRFAQAFLHMNPQYSRIGMMLAVDEELLLYSLSPGCQTPAKLRLMVI